jgi:type I restriction enzyme M protein
MSIDTQQVLSRAWNFAHVLRDDGLSYLAKFEQITFLLSLKMQRAKRSRSEWLRMPAAPVWPRQRIAESASKTHDGVPSLDE